MPITAYSIPIIGRFTKQLNEEIRTVGLQRAFANTLKHSSSTITLRGMTKETLFALKKLPTVVVMNHPYDCDIFCLLGSLPTRKDAYMVMNATMLGVVSNLDKHVVPVYVEHRAVHNTFGRFIGKIIRRMYHTPIYTRAEEHQKNITSIKHASTLLTRGALIVMFPNPGAKQHKHAWRPGIGFLLKDAKKAKNLRVVFAHIQGTSNADYLRFLPLTGHMLPNISITFGEPLDIRGMLRLQPKNITKALEKKYTAWTHAFSA